jgi:hypothetical protein
MGGQSTKHPDTLEAGGLATVPWRPAFGEAPAGPGLVPVWVRLDAVYPHPPGAPANSRLGWLDLVGNTTHPARCSVNHGSDPRAVCCWRSAPSGSRVRTAAARHTT